MEILNNEKLYVIRGGSTDLISATVLNAFSRVMSTLNSIGKMVGSCLRRVVTHTVC